MARFLVLFPVPLSVFTLAPFASYGLDRYSADLHKHMDCFAGSSMELATIELLFTSEGLNEGTSITFNT